VWLATASASRFLFRFSVAERPANMRRHSRREFSYARRNRQAADEYTFRELSPVGQRGASSRQNFNVNDSTAVRSRPYPSNYG